MFGTQKKLRSLRHSQGGRGFEEDMLSFGNDHALGQGHRLGHRQFIGFWQQRPELSLGHVFRHGAIARDSIFNGSAADNGAVTGNGAAARDSRTVSQDQGRTVPDGDGAVVGQAHAVGDLQDRAKAHLVADHKGTVSRNCHIFGQDDRRGVPVTLQVPDVHLVRLVPLEAQGLDQGRFIPGTGEKVDLGGLDAGDGAGIVHAVAVGNAAAFIDNGTICTGADPAGGLQASARFHCQNTAVGSIDTIFRCHITAVFDGKGAVSGNTDDTHGEGGQDDAVVDHDPLGKLIIDFGAVFQLCNQPRTIHGRRGDRAAAADGAVDGAGVFNRAVIGQTACGIHRKGGAVHQLGTAFHGQSRAVQQFHRSVEDQRAAGFHHNVAADSFHTGIHTHSPAAVHCQGAAVGNGEGISVIVHRHICRQGGIAGNNVIGSDIEIEGLVIRRAAFRQEGFQTVIGHQKHIGITDLGLGNAGQDRTLVGIDLCLIQNRIAGAAFQGQGADAVEAQVALTLQRQTAAGLDSKGSRWGIP